MIAKTISGVMASFGISESLRSMLWFVTGERLSSRPSEARAGTHQAKCTDRGIWVPDSRCAASGMTVEACGGFRDDTQCSNLEPLDLVPQRAVLALVGRPDLLLRHLAEFLDLGLDHHHAERLELRLRLGEVVDRLGCLADLDLRLARNVEQHPLLFGRQPGPDFQVHYH